MFSQYCRAMSYVIRTTIVLVSVAKFSHERRTTVARQSCDIFWRKDIWQKNLHTVFKQV